jgi:enolase
MATITSVTGRVINDSRGQPTVEVTVGSDAGMVATASLPLGSSLGRYEAPVVDAETAVTTITTVVTPALLRQPCDMATIDTILQGLFNSAPSMGTNSVLGVSLACARLCAQQQNIPLYQFLQPLSGSPGYSLPTPMFNLINGGKHAHNNLDFQEYLIIPLSMPTFYEKLAAGRKVFSALGQLLAQAGHDTQIGYEGGFAPNLSTNEEGLGMLKQAITTAGYVPGQDIWLGLDVAAASLGPTYTPKPEAYMHLFEDFPLFSIEDPFNEDAWADWQSLKEQMVKLETPNQVRLLVGDDLFVGNKERLMAGIRQYAANAFLFKLTQMPTLTEILNTIKVARDNNYVHIMSHRSGDTLDTFIADLAVATTAAFIKAGAPNDATPERMTKYGRLVQIEEELHAQA